MSELTSIITNVKSFQDVQRALEEFKKILNSIQGKQNPTSTGDESQSDGQVGSVRVIDNSSDGESAFEIKTKEGWKRPLLGKTPISFGEVKSISKNKTKRSIDEIEVEDTSKGGKDAEKTIYDEKEDKFKVSHLTGVPRPDYDSGWVEVDDHRTQGTHNLGVTPTLAQVQWSGDDGVNIHVNWDTISSYGYDIWLSTTTWQVTSSTYYGFYNESTVGGGTGWTAIDAQGKFRVLLWK